MEKYKIDTVKDILNLFPGIIYKKEICRPSIEIVDGKFDLFFIYINEKVTVEHKILCFENESLLGLRNDVLNFIAKEKIKAIWKKQ